MRLNNKQIMFTLLAVSVFGLYAADDLLIQHSEATSSSSAGLEFLGLLEEETDESNALRLEEKAKSLFYLGLMSQSDTYQVGSNRIQRNFAQALVYFQKALKMPELSPIHRARSFANIGFIYYQGGNGVVRNCVEALTYSDKALDMEELSPKQRVLALLRKAEIYCAGGAGVEKDLSSASRMFNHALTIENVLDAGMRDFVKKRMEGIDATLRAQQGLQGLPQPVGGLSSSSRRAVVPRSRKRGKSRDARHQQKRKPKRLRSLREKGSSD